MRICVMSPFSITDKEHWGGMTTHTQMFCCLLVKMGHWVTLITSGQEGRLIEDDVQGVHIINLPVHWMNVPAEKWFKSAAGVFIDQQVVEPFDCFFSEGNSACELIKVNGNPGLPLFCFFHIPSFMHFYNNFQEIDNLKGFIYYFFRSVPVIVHRIFFWERPLARAANKVISVSQRKVGLIKKLYGLNDNRIQTINNWVDTQTFSPDKSLRAVGRKQYNIADDAVCFLLISGALWRPKGFHLAIEGLKRLIRRGKNSVLFISGKDSPEKENLVRLIKKRGLEKNVRFTGVIEHDKLPTLYNSADIFLMPSLMSEGQAYTLLEAMSCGLAPIASRLGGNIESVGDCGILFTCGDQRMLSRAMLELAVNKGKREEFSLKSRKRCLEFFSESIAREKIRGLLENL